MNEIFYTLQDFMLHSESITYLLMLTSLLGILAFWFFLSERDEK